MWDFFTNRGERKARNDSYTPTGLITCYAPSASGTTPEGWLLCLGQVVSRTNYAALDSLIGLTYGAYTNVEGGVGTTHFRLPNLISRVPVGIYAGPGNRTDTNGHLTGTGTITGGSAMSASTLGAWSGTETVSLATAEGGAPAHNHSSSVASHQHAVTQAAHAHWGGFSNNVQVSAGSNFNWQLNGYNPYVTGITAASISPTVTSRSSSYVTTRSNGSTAGSSHTNIQASLGLKFIIKT